MAEKLTRVNKVVRWIQQQYPRLGGDDRARSGIKHDPREAYDAGEITGQWRKPTKQHWDHPGDGLHMSSVETWAEEHYGKPRAYRDATRTTVINRMVEILGEWRLTRDDLRPATYKPKALLVAARFFMDDKKLKAPARATLYDWAWLAKERYVRILSR